MDFTRVLVYTFNDSQLFSVLLITVLKPFFSILVIVAILTQTTSKMIILFNFQLNKEYIAKNLCVKKEEKDNCCQGSCHLKKELEEDDKKTGDTSNPGKIKIEKDEYCTPGTKKSIASGPKEKLFFLLDVKTEKGIKTQIYRPPSL